MFGFSSLSVLTMTEPGPSGESAAQPFGPSDVSRQNNGNLLWQDAVQKEVTNSGIVFEVLQAGAVPRRAGTRYPAT